MNYIYHLATVQYSAGKRRILTLMRLTGDKKKTKLKRLHTNILAETRNPRRQNHTEMTLVPKQGTRCCDNTKSAQEHPKSFLLPDRLKKKVPNPDLMDDVTQNMQPPPTHKQWNQKIPHIPLGPVTWESFSFSVTLYTSVASHTCDYDLH